MPQIRRQRALSLLANSADGRTEARLFSHGFTREVISGLIRDGLATASTGRVGRAPVEVVRIKITEAGRAALAARSGSPGMTGTPPLTGDFPSLPRIHQVMNATNGKAEDKFGLEDRRRKIVNEIMRLSPPPEGCAQRARLVLESKFTFEELQVLARLFETGSTRYLSPKRATDITSIKRCSTNPNCRSPNTRFTIAPRRGCVGLWSPLRPAIRRRR